MASHGLTGRAEDVVREARAEPVPYTLMEGLPDIAHDRLPVRVRKATARGFSRVTRTAFEVGVDAFAEMIFALVTFIGGMFDIFG